VKKSTNVEEEQK